MSPQRIQLRRVKGWRLPAGAVSVGRPTRWGNPFQVGDMIFPADPMHPFYAGYLRERHDHGDAATGQGLRIKTRADAVALYRQWLSGDPRAQEAIRSQLAGRDLACWCPPGEPCHADVLLEVANRP